MTGEMAEAVLLPGIDVRVERVSDSSDVLWLRRCPPFAPDGARTAGNRRDAHTARINAAWMRRRWDFAGSKVRQRVRRYFCDPKSCARETFVDQVPGPSERHRCSSTGLTGWLRSIAIELGGRPVARLCPSAAGRGLDPAAQAFDGAGGPARAFADLVRHRRGYLLLEWILRAEQNALKPMKGFAGFLRQDLDAVTAGLTLSWSSGVVEGNVNRVKPLKWAMYGPALVRTSPGPDPHSAMTFTDCGQGRFTALIGFL
ncbi:hypothetical protein [Streptomyces sp. NPDC058683]|uniref:hypothetical protein n=1 Tax=Streptomyces sp. NPDC058683 TaxID=3346597 RepID=UPI00364D4D16